MTYGTIKVDTVTFTDAGIDKSVTLSGLVQNPTFSGNVTVTGTLSGVTVTGTTANFTSGNFTNISGGTHTITSGVFAAGSAASPSITFTGDLNTGIYSPGADQLAISTGGSGRLFVDAAGAVTVPTRFIIGTANNVGGLSETTRTAAGVFNTSRLLDGGTNPYLQTGAEAGIVYFNADGSSVPAVAFRTGGGERLRITSAGLVGVGTSSPTASTQIETVKSSSTAWAANTIDDICRIYNSNTSTNNASAIYSAYCNYGDGTFTGARFGAISTGSFSAAFVTALRDSDGVFKERLRVDSSGRLGIGTSAPGNNCEIYVGTPSNNDAGITLTNGNNLGFGTSLSFSHRATNGGAIATRSYISSEGGSGNSFLRFATTIGGTLAERVRIDEAGRVGIGTSSPNATLQVLNPTSTQEYLRAGSNSAAQERSLRFSTYTVSGSVDTGHLINAPGTSGNINGQLAFATNGTTALTIDSSQRVGIGTTSPGAALSIGDTSTTASNQIRLHGPASGTAGGSSINVVNGINTVFAAGNASNIIGGSYSSDAMLFWGNADLRFYGNSTERARIDSSGRLLVGTSTLRAVEPNGGSTNGATLTTHFEGISSVPASVGLIHNGTTAVEGSALYLARTRGTAVASSTLVADGDTLGTIAFAGGDGTDVRTKAAEIYAVVDGTPGANDMPGRLVFSTTADGASSPTERMRIINNGAVLIGNTTQFSITSNTATGSVFGSDGTQVTFASAQPVAYFGRQTNDGTIVEFRLNGSVEGSISVSGTTVSYNGAHLSRWSQLLSGAERTEILRGTVLSNIDEMCEWNEEENEQLNRMKVSDVEGDKNVSGVFQAWDDDDDTYTNDFYCAMTGDFIIRIGAGITVERGDLLMSAGDGTAKPQDDDIIRSKTIAKVTSTNVTCTYEDGSYCVPCVLMAC